MITISLVKYEILNKVAEENSFTKAAEILGLTQSAVSHAISSLEKEFGFDLIHRSRTGVKLTGEGQIMLQSMRNVLAAQELLEQEAANILGLTKGTVKLGVISSISSNWMPDIIKIMDEYYPGIQMELREGDYYEIEQWLQSGEIDCGFLNVTKSNQFQFIPLSKDPLLCVVSDKSPLYYQDVVAVEQLAEEPFIMPSYKGTHDVKMIFEQFNVKPNIRFELSDESGIISMIVHHLGITILSQMYTKNLPPSLRAIPLEQDRYRTIGLATKQNLSPATKKFVEILLDWLSVQEV